MSARGSKKEFYEAIWFGDHNEDTPIIKGKSLDNLVELLLEYIKGKSGKIEIYKIKYNNLGYTISLIKKFDVLNNLELI